MFTAVKTLYLVHDFGLIFIWYELCELTIAINWCSEADTGHTSHSTRQNKPTNKLALPWIFPREYVGKFISRYC